MGGEREEDIMEGWEDKQAWRKKAASCVSIERSAMSMCVVWFKNTLCFVRRIFVMTFGS